MDADEGAEADLRWIFRGWFAAVSEAGRVHRIWWMQKEAAMAKESRKAREE